MKYSIVISFENCITQFGTCDFYRVYYLQTVIEQVEQASMG